MTKDQRLANVHAEALAEFDDIQGVMRDERLQCLEDRRFYSISGAQWEGNLYEQYLNKPKFEVNKVHLAVMRIINEYRNNRITVDFVSKDGTADDKLADVCDGLFRADEQDSGSNEAYDNAFEEAVGGGFGAFRLRAVYEDEYDEENEKQRIRIEPIYDADSTVFFDLDAKRQDKADARLCYVLTAMTRDAYRAAWDDDPTTWPKGIEQWAFDWATPDVVYVAEVYRVEEASETIRIFQTIDGQEEKYSEKDFEDDEELEMMLEAVGTKEVRQRRVKRRKVRKYIMSGGKVLEDSGYIAGDQIPIVPVYGKRWFVDNIERCMGHVRLAKDAQRLKNMQLSKLGEISALSTVEKPIFTPEQVAGHEMMWSEDNLRNYPYLLLNTVTDANGGEVLSGPVGYTKPPQIPPALAGLLQITEQDMSDLLGKPDAAEEVVSNVSGKAVELIQQRLDMQTFIYMSNMSKAIKRCGEIWLSMARDILVEPGRKMKSVGLGGELSSIEMGKPILNVETGEVEYENDLSNAKFDVAVEVGPASATKRSATVRSLLGMIQLAPDPETQQVLTSMAMMNMDGEGIGEVRAYFRDKLIKMGVIQPTEQEGEKLLAEMQAAQQPDPQAQYLQAAAMEAQAKAGQAQANTEYTLARAEETRAKTVEVLAGIQQKERTNVVNTAKALQEAVAPGMRQPPSRTM
ncbi:Phage P22-like portal protein [uncultured Caudovirales phage]|uniref:Phage P22-like portal protein n=1 Tax=uncultured Caudovirales phage TaxID=2100421 RepID=A0A6J5P495_9CAUD|nr:Phage P22-like portal protein [uncultured Caudovirales phage]